MSAGTDHDLKAFAETVQAFGDTLAEWDGLTVNQSRAIDYLMERVAELERRCCGSPTPPAQADMSPISGELWDTAALPPVGSAALHLGHPAVPPLAFGKTKVPPPRDLAPGSTVVDRYGSQWTKQADPSGLWKGGANTVTDGMLALAFGPFSKVTEPTQRIDGVDSLKSLSVGARVRDKNGSVWVKNDDRTWSVGRSSRLTSGVLWACYGPAFILVVK